MRFPLSIVWLVLLGAAFAAGWYLRTPQVAPEHSAPLPELARSPDLFELIHGGDYDAGLALVGPAGWPLLAAVLADVTPHAAREGFIAFERRFGPSVDNHLAIAQALLADREFEQAVERIDAADQLAETAEPADAALTRLVDALQQAGLAESHVLGVLEGITLRFPEKPRFQLLLGELMLAAGDRSGADGVLAQIENHPRFGARARQLREGSVPAPGGVPLERVGNQFYVGANLDGTMDVTLMVDTGAAMTVLSAQQLLMLGYDLDAAPKRYFSTAGGVVRAPVVRLERFELGGRTVRDWPVGAIDMPLAADAAGLLGMDFLSRHPFAIDQDRQLLILGPGAATP